MKIFIRSKSLSQKAVDKYKEFADLVDSQEEADLIVCNDFEPIETDKPVAVNVTCADFVSSPQIIDLSGEYLGEVTAVAEWTLANMILLMRKDEPRQQMMYKTLGLIGYGRIASQFAAMAGPHGMHIHYYDKNDDNSTAIEGVLRADVVSLHITASEENRGFMDREKFEMVTDGAYFLNSSRPWLVDMDALKWALDNKLAGAWFDFDLPFEHPKLLTTPHLGGNTIEAREYTELLIVEKVRKWKAKENV